MQICLCRSLTQTSQLLGYQWMQFYRKSLAISTVAQTTLSQSALPIQQANQQACATWYVIVMGTQHIPAQRWPPPLKNSKNHHHPATTRAFLTTKFVVYCIKREVVFKAQDAHTFMCVTSAKEAIQSGPAPTTLNPLPINRHNICTPLWRQIFAQLLNDHPDQAFVSKLITSLQQVLT